MKVLFLNTTGSLGGAERVLLSILAALRETECRPHLLTLEEGPLLSAASELGAEIEVLPLPEAVATLGDSQMASGSEKRNYWGWLSRIAAAVPAGFRFSQELGRRVRQLKPDVIHSNGIKTHLLTGLTRTSDIPVVWHVHDFYGARPLIKRILKYSAKGVRRAIAISQAVATDFGTVLPRIPVRVIYNAIDVDEFCPKEGDVGWLDREARFDPQPDETIRVGLVATYARWKGQDVFLKAASAVREHQPNLPVKFYVIGGPIYKTQGSQFSQEELRRLAQQLGISDCVGFVNFQPRPSLAFQALDIVVHASTKPEPFGLTIVEAMGCGKAVIASAEGGARELFQAEEAIGVTPRDPKALQEAIVRLAQNPELRRRQGKQARRAVLERFSQNRIAAEITNLYGEIRV